MARYTTPKLNKGAKPTSIPKGSTIAKEWAKNVWYIRYTFDGKQVTVKQGINRITDPEEKLEEAEVILKSLIISLKDGYNPFNEGEYLNKVQKSNLSLSDGIVKFVEYHQESYTKKKTISSYKSKLDALSKRYPSVMLKEITLKHLETFVKENINKDDGYSQKTVTFAKATFSTFFEKMIKLEYLEKNPYIGFDTNIKSYKEAKDNHLPYSNTQLAAIMARLDETSAYGALFARFIYNTLLRPSEIRSLKVKDINLQYNTITISAKAKKVAGLSPKADVINIVKSFIPNLKALNLHDRNPTDFIFGAGATIFNPVKTGENTPYNHLVRCLKSFALESQGFDLYSFKHTSNINRFNQGWTMAQLQKANRHSNPTQTNTYLRDITKQTDISELHLDAI